MEPLSVSPLPVGAGARGWWWYGAAECGPQAPWAWIRAAMPSADPLQVQLCWGWGGVDVVELLGVDLHFHPFTSLYACVLQKNPDVLYALGGESNIEDSAEYGELSTKD
eukprot:188156-Chlamydomonas_euryale.AAC.1